MIRSPLLPIFLIVLVDVLALTIIFPLLPLYAETLGASPFVVGLLVSVYAFCQLLAGPVLGLWSDRYGRKPVLLISQLGTFIGLLILAFSKTLALVFLSRIIDGLTAGNLSVAQAYIADVTEAKDRAKSFALIGVAFGLGFLVGPAMTGYLSQFGFHVPILLAAGLSATSILATFLLLPSKKEMASHSSGLEHGASGFEPNQPTLKIKAYWSIFKNQPLAMILWQFAVFAFIFSFFMSGFALYAERQFLYQGHLYGAREIGYTMAFIGLVGLILQGGLVGRLVAWFGERKLVHIGFLCILGGFLMMGEVRMIRPVHMVLVVVTLGTSLLRPCLTSLITQKVDSNQQGLVLGLMQSLMSIAQIFGPMVGALMIQHIHLRLWAWTPAFLSLGGLYLVYRDQKLHPS